MGDTNFTPDAGNNGPVGIDRFDYVIGPLSRRHHLHDRSGREDSELIRGIQGLNKAYDALRDLGGKRIRIGLRFKACNYEGRNAAH